MHVQSGSCTRNTRDLVSEGPKIINAIRLATSLCPLALLERQVNKPDYARKSKNAEAQLAALRKYLAAGEAGIMFSLNDWAQPANLKRLYTLFLSTVAHDAIQLVKAGPSGSVGVASKRAYGTPGGVRS